MLLEKMRRPCSKFYKFATGEADYDLIELATTDGIGLDGIKKHCKIQLKDTSDILSD